MTSVPGSLYFNVGDFLWRMDDATGQFSRIDFRAFATEEVNGELFFVKGASLYKTNGATITDVFHTGGSISNLTNIQGLLYFSGGPSMFGNEPYRSDGTRSGTFKIKELEPRVRDLGGISVGESSNPSHFTEFNGQVYFMTSSSVADSPAVSGVWKTDGSAAGTVQVFQNTPEIMTRFGDKLIVGRQPRLFQLDQADQLSEIKHAGTGAASFVPYNIVELNGQRLLFGNDGQIGNELYRLNSDNTLTLIKDISPGEASTLAYASVVSNGLLYFVTQDVTGAQLYRTDGTAAGTLAIKNFNRVNAIVSFHNQTILAADSSGTGAELWRTDGTATGTVLIKDINVGVSPYLPTSSYPGQFTEFNGQLYFSATQGLQRHVWVTDGTDTGTRVALEVRPQWMLVNQNKLYVATGENGQFRLSRSDGTPAGTTTLSATFTGVGPATVFNNMILFGGSTAEFGNELWKLASTGEPELVKDINVGTGPSLPSEFVEAGGTLYFSAGTAESGRELWQTNGTAATTLLSKDIATGPSGSYPRPLGVLNGVLFFAASDRAHGNELWQTNGGARGVTLVKDIAPGPQSSYPGSMLVGGQEIIFSATTAPLGNELWRIRSVAPVMTLPAVAVEAFRETGPVRLAPDAIVDDRDNPTFLGAVLKVSLGTSYRVGDEVLLLGNSSVTLNRGRILVGGLVVGAFMRPGNGQELKIIFNHDATRSRVQEVLRAVAFNHKTASPVPGQRSLRFDLSDGSGAIATAKVVRVDVVPLDTRPVISGLYGSIASTLNSTGFAFAARAVIKDDNFNLAGGELQVSFQNSRDTTRILIELGGPIFRKDAANNVYKGSVKIGVMNSGGGVGTTPLSIVFNHKVTPATAQELLRSLKLSTPGSTTAGVRIPSIRISDGSSGFSETVTRPYVNIS